MPMSVYSEVCNKEGNLIIIIQGIKADRFSTLDGS